MQATTPEVFDELYAKAVGHFNSLDECYVFDGFAGANPVSRKKVRFVHELAWQQHFVKNMFIRPDEIGTPPPHRARAQSTAAPYLAAARESCLNQRSTLSLCDDFAEISHRAIRILI